MEEKNWSFFDPDLAEKDDSVLIPELRGAGRDEEEGTKSRRRRASARDSDDESSDFDEQEVPKRRRAPARR